MLNIVPHVQAALALAEELHSCFYLVGEETARDLGAASL